MDKPKTAKTKPKATKPVAASKAVPVPPAPTRVPPLFRKIDWITMLIAFGIVWVVYFLTLAPEVTLEDSGELCTGAFYAGIPHPPGYPFWSIYSWLWTVLLPVGNVAWRVEVGEATAAAMACGLVALMVSRGSSMLMEGIEELKSMTGKWESSICMVSGSVAGLLLGFNGVMWSESVAINRISLFGVPWVMLVALCLLRWIYATHQRRYLYCAMFFFGICATIHQTLLVAAMGIEVAVAVAQPRLGRDLFLANSIVYVLGLIGQAFHFINLLDTAAMVLVLYHAVGLASFSTWLWLGVKTRSLGTEWKAVLIMGGLWLLGASFYFYEPIAGMTNPPMQWGYPRTVEGFFHALSRGQYEKANPTDVFGDPWRFLMQLSLLVRGLAEAYNWVIVFVALVPLLFLRKLQRREKAWIIGLTAIYFCIGVLLTILMNPGLDRGSQDLMRVFFSSSHAVVAIMAGYGLALIASYMATHYQRIRPLAMVFAAMAILPAGLSIYSSLAALFGAGGISDALQIFVLILLAIGCVTAAFYLAEKNRQSESGGPFPMLTVVAILVAILFFGWAAYFSFFSGDRPVTLAHLWSFIGQCFTSKDQYGLPVYAGLILLAAALGLLAAVLAYRHRAPLAIMLGLFALMPLYSALDHWAESEQRGHWFGYWFGHDMFRTYFKDKNGQPLYPEMARNAVLYGGTDPGRFCPTYMIFCESFTPPQCQPGPPGQDGPFDRRDVYLITQNALADGTYLCYLRAQYNRSQQIDPPFFRELVRTVLKDKDYETNLLARMMLPLDRFFTDLGARVERRRRTYTSWFTGKDFTNLPDLVTKLRPGDQQDPLSKWLFQNLEPETQSLITGPRNEPRLRTVLAKDLNRLLERELNARLEIRDKTAEKSQVDQKISDGNTSERLRREQSRLEQEIVELAKVGPIYTPERFRDVKLSDYLRLFIAQNPQSDTRIRLNRLLLEAAYPTDIAKSLGGVYPDREIYMATPEDSQRCFQEYLAEAQRRLEHDQKFPNEPRQIKPGEDVHIVDEGGLSRVQVSGQVAVMAINGLITKVIFDHNPANEFYVEESFPLDWMYPYLTPFCDIMKINRHPVPEITEDMIRRDHEFWSQNSGRLIGNWITYDTPVSNIVAFIEKTYLRRNFAGFKGDRAFVRDEQAQKAFSKLRSSVGGVYNYRINVSKSALEQQRMIKEADFAFKQAFAFCPYSPEAVFRYVQLLMNLNRLDDAYLVASTCLQLDPHNGQAFGLVQSLEQMRAGHAAARPQVPAAMQQKLQELEAEVKQSPTNFQTAFNLAATYLSMQQTNRALEILDGIASNAHGNYMAVLTVAQAYAQMGNITRVEVLLESAASMAPDQPAIWYDLSALKASLGKTTEAIAALHRTLDLNAKRLATDPKARNLTNQILGDFRFNALRQTPEFQQLFPSK